MTETFRKGFTYETARSKLFDLISDNARVLRDELSEEKALQDDLHLDSFDLLSIVSAVEGEFDISIPDQDFSRFKTVGDISDELWRRLA